MSDDEEMLDVSQTMTQGSSITQSGKTTQSGFTTQSDSQNLFSSLSNNCNSEPTNDPWGKIALYKVFPRSLGRVSIPSYKYTYIRSYDLVNEITTFGRKGDCDISDVIDKSKLCDVSSIHFTIHKNNGANSVSPVFLEDNSKNGTYFHEHRPSSVAKSFGKGGPIDPKLKRCILADQDVIYVEKKPTCCFEFHSFQKTNNNLPAEINKEYYVGKELGSGACGTVYFAQHRRTCQRFAIKFTTNDRNENNTVATMLKEVRILHPLKHPCILKLFQTKTYINSVAIFIDYMQGGDLYTRISTKGLFSESLSKFVFYQICCAIEYLHSKNVIHRDLKPENILFATTDRYSLVKVSDFGLSKCIQSNAVMQTQCGTVGYLAPEVRTSNYTNKVDIWSLGVILFNCFTGRYPFHSLGSSFSTADNYLLDFSCEEFKRISNHGREIVYETLKIQGERRPSATELLTQRDWLAPTDKDVEKAIEFMNETLCEFR